MFLAADMGISGGNIAVAETGSIVLLTNEGNARLVTTLPKTAQSRRTVHLADQLVEALRQHKSTKSAERRRLGPL